MAAERAAAGTAAIPRVSRRAFLALVGSTAGSFALAAGAQAQGPDSASRAADSARRGSLGYPSVAGRPRAPTEAGDNNPEIQAIEKQLLCTCGCTLDVYTCRTTDFSCTYSPALHREVVALYDEGRTAQEILDTFVAKYGEKALMAPEPEGFNLAGYLLPGVVVTGLGAMLAWVLTRRTAVAAAEAPTPRIDGATADELAELERALAEDGD
jgi:cytochrome c-type biogenesis protein CcmH